MFYRNLKKFSVEELVKYPTFIHIIDSFLNSFFVSTNSVIDYLVLAKFRFQGDKISEPDFKEINEFLEH
jgi:hypothetical protein